MCIAFDADFVYSTFIYVIVIRNYCLLKKRYKYNSKNNELLQRIYFSKSKSNIHHLVFSLKQGARILNRAINIYDVIEPKMSVIWLGSGPFSQIV